MDQQRKYMYLWWKLEKKLSTFDLRYIKAQLEYTLNYTWGCTGQPNTWLPVVLCWNYYRNPEAFRWDPSSKSLSFKQHSLTFYLPLMYFHFQPQFPRDCMCLQKNSVFVFQLVHSPLMSGWKGFTSPITHQAFPETVNTVSLPLPPPPPWWGNHLNGLLPLALHKTHGGWPMQQKPHRTSLLTDFLFIAKHQQ